MRKYTDAKKEGNRKWDSANLDRISVALPKGRKAELQAMAEQNKQSVNGFLNGLIDKALAQRSADTVPTDGHTAVSVPEESPGSDAGDGFSISVQTPDEILCSRFPILSAPSFQTALSLSKETQEEFISNAIQERITTVEREQNLPFLPVPPWEDTTPEMEERLIAVLRRMGVDLPTQAQYKALSPEQQQQVNQRLFALREKAHRAFERKELAKRQHGGR